jgi:hypothetical protein
LRRFYGSPVTVGDVFLATSARLFFGFMGIWAFDLRAFVATSVASRPLHVPRGAHNVRSMSVASSSPVRKSVLTKTEAEALAGWSDSIESWPVGSHSLWLADGVDALLAADDRGVVRSHVVDALRWEPVELTAGDVLLDGLAPPLSEDNRSPGRRRVFVANYAPTAEGSSRDRYYAARAETMRRASQQDGRFRISTLADFDGVEVAERSAPPDVCTHIEVS